MNIIGFLMVVTLLILTFVIRSLSIILSVLFIIFVVIVIAVVTVIDFVTYAIKDVHSSICKLFKL